MIQLLIQFLVFLLLFSCGVEKKDTTIAKKLTLQEGRCYIESSYKDRTVYKINDRATAVSDPDVSVYIYKKWDSHQGWYKGLFLGDLDSNYQWVECPPEYITSSDQF